MNIRQLTLYTANLQQQVEFYTRVLQLPVIHQNKTAAGFKAGNSILNLIFKPDASPYHFAFNIPSNKATEALNWLRARVEILGFQGEDLIDFSNWNAESMYFYDADKNIVELIARKNLHITEEEPFSPQQLISISEIGVATSNIEKTYGQLNVINPLPVYDGNFDRFCAAGDEHGLFISADMNKKQWFPAGDVIRLSDFILQGDYNIEYKDGEVTALND